MLRGILGLCVVEWKWDLMEACIICCHIKVTLISFISLSLLHLQYLWVNISAAPTAASQLLSRASKYSSARLPLIVLLWGAVIGARVFRWRTFKLDTLYCADIFPESFYPALLLSLRERFCLSSLPISPRVTSFSSQKVGNLICDITPQRVKVFGGL